MLINILKADLMKTRIAKDSKKQRFLSTIVGDLQSNARLVDGEKVVSDQDVQALLKKYMKGIKETLEYDPNNVQAFYEKEIISHYMPKELSDEELRAFIQQQIDRGVTKIGDIMKALKSNYDGQYCGKKASSFVKEMTS